MMATFTVDYMIFITSIACSNIFHHPEVVRTAHPLFYVCFDPMR